MWDVATLWRKGLIILIGLYLVVGATYVVTTPVFESPDEDLHVQYIRFLVANRSLPVYAGTILPMRQEASQPPLYYMIAAIATSWVDWSDFDAVAAHYPNAVIGRADIPGNRNAFVHTPAESALPGSGSVLAVRLARTVSLLFGIVVLVATAVTARRLFPDRPGLALGSAALVAFTPGFLFIAASANNDMLASATAATTLALLTDGWRRGWVRWRIVALGIVIGAASLSKLNALGVAPLTGLFVTLSFAAQAGWRRWRVWAPKTLGAGTVMIAMAFVVGGWWYVRNALLYGDPLASSVHFDVMAARSAPPALGTLLSLLEGVFKSWWGVFGWFNVIYPDWVYTVCALVSGLALMGLFVAWARDGRRSAIGMLLIWAGMFFALLIGWGFFRNLQGRLLLPAMPAIAILMSVGLTAWIPGDRLRLRVVGAGLGLLGVAAALTPWLVIAPAYAVPRALTVDEVAAIPEKTDMSFAGVMTLLGYRVEADRVAPGEALRLTLYWRVDAPMDRIWSVFVHLTDETGVIVAQRDQYPGMGAARTTELFVGQTLADEYRVEIPKTSFAPAEAVLSVGLYDAAVGERLPSLDGSDHLDLAAISIAARPGDVPNQVDIDFEGGVRLAGYDLDRRVAAPGETVRLTLYWRGMAPIATNYSVFTHVRGEGNALWAGHDGWPAGGAAPTGAWSVGEVIVDPHELVLSTETPVGVHTLEIGLYDGDGARLRLAPADDRPMLGDFLDLTLIRVVVDP